MAILQGFSALLFPYGLNCPFCGALAPRKADPLCKNCRNEVDALLKDLRACNKCGRFIPKIEYFCEECNAMKDFPFIIARAAVLYEGKIKENMHLFKYFGKRSLAKAFSQMMVKVLNTEKAYPQIEAVVAVPLHTNRLQERAFNQAEDLAIAVAQKINKPYLHDALWRSIDTPTQVALNKKERNQNLKGAFNVSNPDAIKGKKLLLIDDIFTTGSTVTEVTRKLLEEGAESVSVLSLASGKAARG